MALCFLVAASVWQARAYAEASDYEVIDSIEIRDQSYLDGETDVPSELMDMAVRRTDGDQLLSIDGDTVSLRSAEDWTDDGDLGTAASILWDSYMDSRSTSEANDKLMEDLIWRWYNADSSKRDKIPVVPYTGNWAPLTDFDSIAEWYAYMQGRGQFVLYTAQYRLVGFDDNKSWDSTSPNAEIEYTKWYEWFEGSSSGGQPVEGYTQMGTVVGYSRSGYSSPPASDFFYVDGGWQTVNDYALQAYFHQTPPVSLSNPYVFKGMPVYVSNSILSSLEVYNDVALSDGVVFFFCSQTNGSGVPSFHGYCFNADSFSLSTNPIVSTILPDAPSVTYSGHAYCELYRVTSSYHDDAYYIESCGLTKKNNNISGNNVSGLFASTTVDIVTNNEPVYPSFPQPDTPTQPQPITPQLPDPYSPVVNDTTTTTVDLQPILDAIRILNDNVTAGFESVNSALEACCSNMQALLTSWFSYFGDWLDMIWQQLRTVNGWLEGIYWKLGAGDASQPDPSIDNPGWWDWLSGIADAVVGDLPSSLADLASSFNALRNVFPFSVPWDLAAMLALFMSSPVTPVFDLPVPFASGAGGTAYVHVDLSAWDGVMASVRSVELVAFAAGLALKTRDMLKNVEVD